eukprot:TRINITY_DN11899_c0_g1_i1.p1 TRINITY_DN11899_c0_g1~~TRINITY_DN11899_c0_g1_i1.p1  ORF type:complete len:187 (-),score=64.73 TRINITY_DN11899_c0_g1_i1:207-716(-)
MGTTDHHITTTEIKEDLFASFKIQKPENPSHSLLLSDELYSLVRNSEFRNLIEKEIQAPETKKRENEGQQQFDEQAEVQPRERKRSSSLSLPFVPLSLPLSLTLPLASPTQYQRLNQLAEVCCNSFLKLHKWLEQSSNLMNNFETQLQRVKDQIQVLKEQIHHLRSSLN